MRKPTGSRQILLLPGWPALRVATKQDRHWTAQTWDQNQLQLTVLAEVSDCKELGDECGTVQLMVSWKLCFEHILKLLPYNHIWYYSFLQGGLNFSVCSSCSWSTALDPGTMQERWQGSCCHSVWCGRQTMCLFKRRKKHRNPLFSVLQSIYKQGWKTKEIF